MIIAKKSGGRSGGSPQDRPPPHLPKFRSFPSPATIFFLSSLSWGSSSWNFGGVFEGRGFGLSSCRVKPLSGSGFLTKIPREEGRNKENCGGRGKKREILVSVPRLSGPHFGSSPPFPPLRIIIIIMVIITIVIIIIKIVIVIHFGLKIGLSDIPLTPLISQNLAFEIFA